MPDALPCPAPRAVEDSQSLLLENVSAKAQQADKRTQEETGFTLSGLKIVLLGKNTSENSRVGNNILGTAAFDSEASSYSQQPVQKVSGEVEKRPITVINTPHLLQPNLTQHQITEGVSECLSLSAPGPHAIALVLQYNDFREENRQRVKTVLNLFSKKAIKHTIVLTTDEETRTSKWASMVMNNAIHNLIKECGGRHLQFDAISPGWRSEMFRRIEKMLKDENKEFLISNMYEDGGDGSSVDEDLSRSGGSVQEDDKEEDSEVNDSAKTGSDGRGLSFFPEYYLYKLRNRRPLLKGFGTAICASWFRNGRACAAAGQASVAQHAMVELKAYRQTC
ncbi:GTPase IMAP family member 7-like [Pseudorasbora parva]|uniref:GTPase IMAP family member 7-like n=1 Tax=Pseudorasbora parva TaxID=51549 RepID=UPI00351DFD7F